MIEIFENAEHPTTEIVWDENGQLLDFSQGYTFSCKVLSCRDPKRQITKTSNIFAYRNQRPNVIIKWQPTAELSTLIPGLYTLQLTATNSQLSSDYVRQDTLMIRPVI